VDQVQFLARSFQPIVLAGVPLPRFPPTCSAAAVTQWIVSTVHFRLRFGLAVALARRL
jgi:hypothetical protein